MNVYSIVVLCLVLVLISTTEGHRRYDRRRKAETMINGTCTFSFPCNVKERTMVVAIYTRSVNLKVSQVLLLLIKKKPYWNFISKFQLGTRLYNFLSMWILDSGTSQIQGIKLKQ